LISVQAHDKLRPLELLGTHRERIEAWVLKEAGVPFDAKASAATGLQSVA
jgi:hypothetical protein